MCGLDQFYHRTLFSTRLTNHTVARGNVKGGQGNEEEDSSIHELKQMWFASCHTVTQICDWISFRFVGSVYRQHLAEFVWIMLLVELYQPSFVLLSEKKGSVWRQRCAIAQCAVTGDVCHLKLL